MILPVSSGPKEANLSSAAAGLSFQGSTYCMLGSPSSAIASAKNLFFSRASLSGAASRSAGRPIQRRCALLATALLSTAVTRSLYLAGYSGEVSKMTLPPTTTDWRSLRPSDITNTCGLKLSPIFLSSSTQLNLSGLVSPVLFLAKRPSSTPLRQALRGMSRVTPPHRPSAVESPTKATLLLASLWPWAAPAAASDSARAAPTSTANAAGRRRDGCSRRRGARAGTICRCADVILQNALVDACRRPPRHRQGNARGLLPRLHRRRRRGARAGDEVLGRRKRGDLDPGGGAGLVPHMGVTLHLQVH